jgi:hypothetical protein
MGWAATRSKPHVWQAACDKPLTGVLFSLYAATRVSNHGAS